MKILVAIKSDKKSDEMVHTTLRWAARAGYEMRIFIPDGRQLKKYEAAVEEANYQYYFDIPPSVLVTKQEPMDFARENGYDLLILLPDDMLDWRTVKDDDKTFIEYAQDVGAARTLFGQNENLNEHDFGNGAKMLRVR